MGSQYKDDNSVGVGAAVCAGTAFVANYAFEHFRKAVVEWSGLHDFTVAMMEDQMCVGLCAAVAIMGPPKQAADKQLDHATSADQGQDYGRNTKPKGGSNMPNIRPITELDINHPDHMPRVPEMIMGVTDVVISILTAMALLGYGPKGGSHAERANERDGPLGLGNEKRNGAASILGAAPGSFSRLPPHGVFHAFPPSRSPATSGAPFLKTRRRAGPFPRFPPSQCDSDRVLEAALASGSEAPRSASAHRVD